MNKDHELKNDIEFQSSGLRSRIYAAIKQVREDENGGESKQTQAKTLPIIPVTGKSNGGSCHKYIANKQKDEF